jgi:hydrogenase maturation protease
MWENSAVKINELQHLPDRLPHRQFIVIGYGNTLRGDDGAGQKVAEIVDSWNLPQMQAIAAHQLTPEFAALLTESELAIFVDVYPVAEQSQPDEEIDIRVIPIHPCTYRHYSTSGGAGHSTDPHSLMCLAEIVYGKAPPAWWILIPAHNFEFGEQLSDLTTTAMNKALQQIKQIMQAHLEVT